MGSWRLLQDAMRVVALRLVPAIIEAHDRGQPAAFGSARTGQEGVTVPGPGGLVPWRDIRSIRVQHIDLPRRHGRVVRAVRLSCRARPAHRAIGISGLPDCIVAPHVIAHAAAQHGVRVRGRPSSRLQGARGALGGHVP